MKFCSKCGSQQPDDAVFCNKCGASFNNAVIPPQQPQQQYQQAQYDQPIYQQQFQQPQFQPQFAQAGAMGGTVAAKGSKKKLIIIISAIVAVIGITLLILFLFVFKSNKDKIIGTWVCDGEYLRFYKDGTVEINVGNNNSKATYKIDGDTLTITENGKSGDYKITKIDSKEMQLTLPNGITATFTKTDDKEIGSIENSYTMKVKLKDANAYAKLIFTICNNKASDMIADGKDVEKLEYSGPVSGLSGVLGNAVKEALKDNGADGGYVYIYFDPNDDYATDSQNFAQWSASEDGLIGQYPDPIKTVDDAKKATFGRKYSS